MVLLKTNFIFILNLIIIYFGLNSEPAKPTVQATCGSRFMGVCFAGAAEVAKTLKSGENLKYGYKASYSSSSKRTSDEPRS